MLKNGEVVILLDDKWRVIIQSRYSVTLENMETKEILIADKKSKQIKKTSINERGIK